MERKLGAIIINDNRMSVHEYPTGQQVCGEQRWDGDFNNINEMLENVFSITDEVELDLMVVGSDKNAVYSFVTQDTFTFLPKHSEWDLDKVKAIFPNTFDDIASVLSSEKSGQKYFIWYVGISEHVCTKNKSLSEVNHSIKKNKVNTKEKLKTNTGGTPKVKDLAITPPSKLYLMFNKKTKEYEDM